MPGAGVRVLTGGLVGALLISGGAALAVSSVTFQRR